MSFDITPYEEEIKTGHMIHWTDMFYDYHKTEKDMLVGIIYTIQQSTYAFNKMKLPKLKTLLRKYTTKEKVVCYKGLYWANIDNTDVKALIEPWEEFVSTTTDIEVARTFSYGHGHKDSYKGLQCIVRLTSEEYFKVDKSTGDMGESEFILIDPILVDIVEVRYIE
jgi:hypothetical protein